MTLDEAQEAIARHLARLIGQPQVSVSLLQASGVQQIAGEHLIGPDGHLNLGIYGSVYVSGLTVDEARLAIEALVNADAIDGYAVVLSLAMKKVEIADLSVWLD